MFVGDVPLPMVFSFLSSMLMASDAPSGICEGGRKRRKRRERGWEERQEETEGVRSGVSWGAPEQHH